MKTDKLIDKYLNERKKFGYIELERSLETVDEELQYISQYINNGLTDYNSKDEKNVKNQLKKILISWYKFNELMKYELWNI